MNKEWYQSLTFWGAVLLGLSTTLEQLGAQWPVLLPIAQGIGTLMTIFGIRRAIK